ncbi:hypothetical protein [Marinimicrobium alkaliphilum]|uniref:hypothetical protein n=1 Tax=Marinimicrobium alkaliphilum TaxID=2202654 RepID=UPI000DBA950E|nr:hypothetical protein [Marinimicrobium alkaliphilum]
MNSNLLLRHYPELHHLPPEAQLSVLEKAKEDAFGQSQKLRIWRKNMVTLAIICAISFGLVMWVGPALGLPGVATAVVMMVVVLPVFMIVQQRRYIADLRPAVQARLAAYEQAQ